MVWMTVRKKKKLGSIQRSNLIFSSVREKVLGSAQGHSLNCESFVKGHSLICGSFVQGLSLCC